MGGGKGMLGGTNEVLEINKNEGTRGFAISCPELSRDFKNGLGRGGAAVSWHSLPRNGRNGGRGGVAGS